MNNDATPVETSADHECREEPESTDCSLSVPVDGFQIATMRADRKKQTTISVKLFKGDQDDKVEVGRLMFMRKNLPDDSVESTEEGKVIFMHALVTDFERMMALVGGKWPVELGYCGADEEKGRAFLKSPRHVFPKRDKTP